MVSKIVLRQELSRECSRALGPHLGRRARRPAACAAEQAVARVLRAHGRVVLAVSGGRDSMVMLHAALSVAREHIAAVATFDHHTGPAAAAASDLVRRVAADAGLRVEAGRAERPEQSEVRWREARWRFLRAVAGRLEAPVATAHTLDDQIETVLIRVLRGAGARGLAALYAESDVLRPLLGVSRADVAAYAARHNVGWVHDPSNQSRRFLRNRVRLDLLPALAHERPALPGELLALSRRAAEWRTSLDRFVAEHVHAQSEGGELRVAREELLRYDARGLALIWPVLAARAGVTLDRRGTRRLATFTIEGEHGSRIQLSGGYEVVLHRGSLRLRRSWQRGDAAEVKPLADGLVLGGWRFRRVPRASAVGLWTAHLPADRPLLVRAWRHGDRMAPDRSDGPRRVKRLLHDAGIDAAARPGWPVVLAGGEIVWIPGVRRSAAATAGSGGPAISFACDRLDD